MEAYLSLILFGGFLVLLLLGAPITISLAGASMAAYLLLDKNPIALVQIAFTSVGNFPLMALPAFVLAGALMEAAGISRRLVDIAEINGMSKQAIGQIANEIEELGYIQRIPDLHDGRAKNLVFTELGERLIQDSIAMVEEVEAEFAQMIGEEKIQQLESLLAELSDSITASNT